MSFLTRLFNRNSDHVPGRSAAHEAARKRGDKARTENNKSDRVKRPRPKKEK